ncbi:hypothetical protein [Dinghuibacter silviterrae]|uniref:Uncharacterized protein n=1 Tax=Dinghuibacter silviterrae TaxID=1539049 RepID=A0A4R8DSY1_9BACT|nr:hypothetical protein [Dinghuibacter silviterrae]TDX01360.1 hypothetical protein EDB95_2394 [Dinghuibacter silviterrae]
MGSIDLLHPDSKCKVCGAPLYSTDHDNHEITYHCSSPEARFWDFERGTRDQDMAKNHWDQSREEIFLK